MKQQKQKADELSRTLAQAEAEAKVAQTQLAAAQDKLKQREKEVKSYSWGSLQVLIPQID